MIEWCAPLLPASVAWIAGYIFLLRDESNSYTPPDWMPTFMAPVVKWLMPDRSPKEIDVSDNNLPEIKEDNGQSQIFLKEAVRLAEERMKAQEEVTKILQGKAYALGTLCVLIMVFMYSKFSDTHWLTLMAYVSLFFSVLYSAGAINFARHGQRGLPPSSWISEWMNIAKMLHAVLQEYEHRIGINAKTNKKKSRYLYHARWLWVIGAGACLGVMAKGNDHVVCTCGWLT